MFLTFVPGAPFPILRYNMVEETHSGIDIMCLRTLLYLVSILVMSVILIGMVSRPYMKVGW